MIVALPYSCILANDSFLDSVSRISARGPILRSSSIVAKSEEKNPFDLQTNSCQRKVYRCSRCHHIRKGHVCNENGGKWLIIEAIQVNVTSHWIPSGKLENIIDIIELKCNSFHFCNALNKTDSIEYKVDAITDRYLLPGGFQENDAHYIYRVSWCGFDEENDTWEPFDSLKNCPLKFSAFKRQKMLNLWSEMFLLECNFQ